eukprot:TRINITY_DN16417_c0_g1_i1.p1 TRINITY_DN16417_c0_g1~~TRINITY_DN16417_c0_g1_i1.p1  ORF type:complete len:264 (-),score=36.07 TRINITY_DN16417_c0_g1_i1:126-917(-)
MFQNRGGGGCKSVDEDYLVDEFPGYSEDEDDLVKQQQQQQRIQQIGPVSQEGQPEYQFVSSHDPSLKITLVNQHQKGLSFQVWPSSVALANYAVQQNLLQPGIYKNQKVLELGSGCGLSGLVFAALGAHVILTDLEKVVPMLTQTIQLNQQCLQRNQGSARAQTCTWGETHIQDFGDWSSSDLIIAADVVYHAELFDPLLSQLKQFPSGTNVLIAHIRRWKSDNKFFKQLSKYFRVNEIQVQQEYESQTKCRQQLFSCKRNEK